jgi:hypothetical protein
MPPVWLTTCLEYWMNCKWETVAFGPMGYLSLIGDPIPNESITEFVVYKMTESESFQMAGSVAIDIY